MDEREKHMNKKLYVGNLSFRTEEQTLQALFAEAGPVQSVRLMQDKATGQSRGFAFVEMETEDAAQAAIDRFNGQELEGPPRSRTAPPAVHGIGDNVQAPGPEGIGHDVGDALRARRPARPDHEDQVVRRVLLPQHAQLSPSRR